MPTPARLLSSTCISEAHKAQWNGEKFWRVYVSAGYNVWNSNCRNAGKDCVILPDTHHVWGKAGKPLPSWSSAAQQAASLGAAAREVVTPFSKPLLTLTARVPAKERTENCSVEVPWRYKPQIILQTSPRPGSKSYLDEWAIRQPQEHPAQHD